MSNYRFTLDLTSKKFFCPKCNKRTFVKYIDTTNNEYLPDHYGRCDRERKCKYHLNPYKDGYFKKSLKQESEPEVNFQNKELASCRPQPKQKIKEPFFIPFEILKATRKGYEQNIFIQNLLHYVPFPFDIKDIEKVRRLYQLGTICKGYRIGAITFPFIDINGNIRTIQVKEFDKTNHSKSTDFLHSIYKRDCEQNNKPLPKWLSEYLLNDKKVPCFFGEHLITKYPKNPIALVEAPKTAIIANLYFGFPDDPKNLLWLAVYNLSSLNIEKCKVLQGRKIFLFPDLGAYDNWCDKARKLQKELPETGFKVSDLIQIYSTQEEKQKGLDIADFLIQMNWKDFRQQ